MLTINKTRHKRLAADGVEIHYREAGSRDKPTVVLLHGYPASSHMFRNIIAPLADVAHVVAPDMPAFGFSAMPSMDEYDYTFETISRTIEAFLAELGVTACYLYMQDWGAVVGYYLATRAPERIRGLIVQNGAAHEDGLGPEWDSAKAFWADPSEANRAALGEWRTFEGVRNEYLGGAPEALQALHPCECWHLDWERMSRPGNAEIQFKLFQDFRNHVARVPQIEAYHRTHQPRCLLLWGKHDPFFALGEVLAFNRVLDMVETHIFNGGHFLLETHHQECVALMKAFIEDAEAGGGVQGEAAARIA